MENKRTYCLLSLEVIDSAVKASNQLASPQTPQGVSGPHCHCCTVGQGGWFHQTIIYTPFAW